jgi:hypothetical protein
MLTLAPRQENEDGIRSLPFFHIIKIYFSFVSEERLSMGNKRQLGGDSGVSV